MNYWLNLFTGTTWNEFHEAGAKVTGFREHNLKRANPIAAGDLLLCYMTGVKRWVGALEVTGGLFEDDSPIWGEEVFPVRFPVKCLIALKPEHGVPMKNLEGKLSFYPAGATAGQWTGHLRCSPTRYRKQDAEVIFAALKDAEANPTERPVDPKLLRRSSNLYKLSKKSGAKKKEAVVTVPTKEEEDEQQEKSSIEPLNEITHTEIQWRLLNLGSQMGLGVWAPRADRGRAWDSRHIKDIPRLLDALPTQFDDATNKTIENIDVLWLTGNTYAAAFEVEHTTSIYSGLLRMSDLLTMQPNITIKLYLVAPDERFSKFRSEVPRPTFASSNRPLHTVCGFLPYSELCKRLESAKDFLCHLKPDFIDDIAEFYDPADEFDA